MTKRLGFACPHCKAQSNGIKTRVLDDLLMEVTYRCSRNACGHVFVASVEAIRTLSPSALPDPEILRRLPISEHVKRAIDLMVQAAARVVSSADPLEDTTSKRHPPQNLELFREVPALG